MDKRTGTHVLMNVVDEQEMRVVVIRDGSLVSVSYERMKDETQQLGNICKGRIANVEQSLDAAFVDLGLGKNGFLHVDEVKHDKGPEARIQDILETGQELVVQVTKEAIKDKGPCVSTYLSIPGRYLVLVSDSEGRKGVSRKIDDPTARRRLRDLLASLEPPAGFGFIMRTAAADRHEQEIRLDALFLKRIWEEITGRSSRVKAPASLFQEADLVVRTLRDLVPDEVQSVVIDEEDIYDEARAFAQVFLPELSTRIQLHREALPIFTFYGIEERLAAMSDRKVPLPSGGNVVIEQTEALVAIDVNSSKNRSGENVAMTALQTNLEAVQVISEQLILRDLGGLIVIDFIDMDEIEHRRLVQLAHRRALLKDKAKTLVAPISRIGLVEMTRQRTRPSHGLVSQGECPHCHGTGTIRTTETFEIDCLRALRRTLAAQACSRIEIVVPHDLAVALLNSRRKELSLLEEQQGCRIVITGDPLMQGREFKLVTTGRQRRGKGRKDDGPVGPSLLKSLMEEHAAALAEVQELMKKNPRDLERELTALTDERQQIAPAPLPSSPPVGPAGADVPAPVVPAPIPTVPTLWEEAAELRRLLFATHSPTLASGRELPLARPTAGANKTPPYRRSRPRRGSGRL